MATVTTVLWNLLLVIYQYILSALTLLVGWQEEHLACKNLSGGVLVKYRFAYGPADATATHYLLLQSIQTGFTFLVPPHPGSPRQRAIKQV